MILRSVCVQNFKCIDDSQEFSVDSGLTCLVGKNESGKSAILEAIYKLNPVVDDSKDFLDLEYPRRRWSEYKERKGSKPDTALITDWELNEAEMELIPGAIGPKTMKIPNVTIKKDYANRQTWSFNPRPQGGRGSDHRSGVRAHRGEGTSTLARARERVSAQRRGEGTSPYKRALRLRNNGFPLVQTFLKREIVGAERRK